MSQLLTEPEVASVPVRGRLRIAMIGGRGLPDLDGGVERSVEALSRELAALGQDVTVYGRRPYCDSQRRVFGGVKQIPLPCITTKHLEAVTHSGASTLHSIFQEHHDVIHFHAIGPAMLSLVPRLVGRPSVATVHALDYQREKWGPAASLVLRGAAKVASSVPDATIAVSHELADHVSAISGREAHYIPNGVELPPLSSERAVSELDGQRFALFLGRLVPEKGVHTLITAFRQLQDPSASLAIVGEQSHTSGYESHLRHLAGADPRIKFLGSRKDGQKLWLLRRATVFVQPSVVEGLPIAVLEACACGTPVIISDIPANVEAAASHTGRPVLVRPGDHVMLRAALAECLAAEPNTLSPPTIATEHRWRYVAERTLDVYQEATQSWHSHHIHHPITRGRRTWIFQ